MGNDPREDQWHLDKRVPIALIVTLFMQTGAAMWWGASLTERVAQMERQLASTATEASETDRALSNQAAQIAVLIEQMSSTNRSVDRLFGQVADTNNLIRQMLQEGR